MATAAMVILGGALLTLVMTTRLTLELTNGQLASLTSAQIAADRLTTDLRQARQANLACPKVVTATCTFPPCVQFNPVAGGPMVTYERNGSGTLVRTAAAPQIVAQGLTSFTPLVCSAGLVRVALATQVQTRAGPTTQMIESQVWVKNP